MNHSMYFPINETATFPTKPPSRSQYSNSTDNFVKMSTKILIAYTYIIISVVIYLFFLPHDYQHQLACDTLTRLTDVTRRIGYIDEIFI